MPMWGSKWLLNSQHQPFCRSFMLLESKKKPIMIIQMQPYDFIKFYRVRKKIVCICSTFKHFNFIRISKYKIWQDQSLNWHDGDWRFSADSLADTLCKRINNVIRENRSTQAFPPARSHLCSYLATVLTTYRKARKC